MRGAPGRLFEGVRAGGSESFIPVPCRRSFFLALFLPGESIVNSIDAWLEYGERPVFYPLGISHAARNTAQIAASGINVLSRERGACRR